MRRKQENGRTMKLFPFLRKTTTIAAYYVHPETELKISGTSNIQV